MQIKQAQPRQVCSFEQPRIEITPLQHYDLVRGHFPAIRGQLCFKLAPDFDSASSAVSVRAMATIFSSSAVSFVSSSSRLWVLDSASAARDLRVDAMARYASVW